MSATKGRLLVVDDDELILTVLSRSLKKEGYEVLTETNPHEVDSRVRSWSPDIVLLDVGLPQKSGIEILRELKSKGVSTEVVMLTADDTAEAAVKAMKLGAVDYLTKPFDIDELKIVLSKIIEKIHLEQEVDYLRKITSDLIDKNIIGESAIIKELRNKIAKIAQARVSTVLITGESGTGKELVARYTHDLIRSGTSSEHVPFVGVNCAALPETLLESELFGHEKGAFTDAKSDKRGVFELANGGTILLDEIGEMKPGLQSKLLRVLENRKMRRVGGNVELDVDATVIATTNRNLSEAVQEGEFRTDLFYRLNAFSLHIAPLRERREDIPLLARHFLAHFAKRYNNKAIKGFSREAEEFLLAHSWKGNVRELKNVIERIVVLESAEVIMPEHLPKEITNQTLSASAPQSGTFILPESGLSFDELERDLIQQAYERAEHNKTLAAKLLNMSYDTFRYKAKKIGLE